MKTSVCMTGSEIFFDYLLGTVLSKHVGSVWTILMSVKLGLRDQLLETALNEHIGLCD